MIDTQLKRRVRTALLMLPLALSAGGAAAQDSETETAVFAGGCFWCVEAAFDPIDGVVDHTAGYAGGHVEDPSYDAVTGGGTGHKEVVRVTYDPEEVTYKRLLYVFWRNVDPLDDGGQFCDRGPSYKTAIFVGGPEQRAAAKASKQALADSGRFDQPIVTPITDLDQFYPAEGYHQDYFQEKPFRYKFYTQGCGRYDRLDAVWGEEARPGQDK